MKQRLPLPAVVTALALSMLPACLPKAGTAPGPLTATALGTARNRWADATEDSLEKGRQFYLGACDNCHKYPDLPHYAEEKWPEILARMGQKAELTPEETELVLRFVLAARSIGLGGAL